MAFVKKNDTTTVDQDQRDRPRDLAGLLAELTGPNPVARRWAVKDLAAYPESAQALADHLEQEADASVREAVLLSLTEIGDTIAVNELVNCLRSEDAHLRNEAIEAMKLLPDAVALIMAGLLVDPEPDVRIFAVNVLESLRHPDVEKWLLEVIEEDAHINVCGTAVDLLGEVGTELAVEPLRALKARFPQEPYITFAADIALKRIGDTE